MLADGATTEGVAKVCGHADLSDDKGVAAAQSVEDFCGRVLELRRGDDVVETMDVPVKELIVVEMVFSLLPSADFWSITEKITVANFAQTSNIIESIDIRVHRGDEQPRVCADAMGDVSGTEEGIDPDLKRPR